MKKQETDRNEILLIVKSMGNENKAAWNWGGPKQLPLDFISPVFSYLKVALTLYNHDFDKTSIKQEQIQTWKFPHTLW